MLLSPGRQVQWGTWPGLPLEAVLLARFGWVVLDGLLAVRVVNMPPRAMESLLIPLYQLGAPKVILSANNVSDLES